MTYITSLIPYCPDPFAAIDVQAHLVPARQTNDPAKPTSARVSLGDRLGLTAAHTAGRIPATMPMPQAKPKAIKPAPVTVTVAKPIQTHAVGTVHAPSLWDRVTGPFRAMFQTSGRKAPLSANGHVAVTKVGHGFHLLGSLPADHRPDLGASAEAKAAFHTMQAAALQSGVVLSETSNYRSVELQTKLWRASDRSGRWVAAPGHSEHQTGLAFDVGTKGYNGGQQGNFAKSPAFRWLCENGYRYGFVQSMSWEPWHWRYDPQSVQLALNGTASESQFA